MGYITINFQEKEWTIGVHKYIMDNTYTLTNLTFWD
jgi:uncharacterized protein YebE (UPF0316 family)